MRQNVPSLPISPRRRLASQPELFTLVVLVVLDGMCRCETDGVPSLEQAVAPADYGIHALRQSLITQLMKRLTRQDLWVNIDDFSFPASVHMAVKLKTSWRDGTTQMVTSPLEFIQRKRAMRVSTPRYW